MTVIAAYPPNIDALDKAFEVRGKKGIIFTYAPHIYVPGGEILTPALQAHEEVHLDQQIRAGGPEAWWEQYLRDTTFRAQEELKAHRVEYATYCMYEKDKNQRNFYLVMISQRLASKMYGRIMTVTEARKGISQ